MQLFISKKKISNMFRLKYVAVIRRIVGFVELNTNIKLLGAFEKLRKATVIFVMSLRPSVRMELLGSYWMDFREIC